MTPTAPICAKCGKRHAEPGDTICHDCNFYRREEARQWRKYPEQRPGEQRGTT